MKAEETPRATTAAGDGSPEAARPRWWRELLYVLGFYGIYTLVRDTQGSAGEDFTARGATTAYHHAAGVIRFERDVWLYHERAIQDVFVGWARFIQFWNVYYGTAHFVVTVAAIVWLFVRQPARYAYWRNVLALCTGLALVGFAAYPLMPPRLLDTASALHPSIRYGFVDTLVRYGGSWSFDSGTMREISNQYAAMPSLHFGWSSFCAFVFYPACRRWWTKALVILYPVATLFAIVVTANHFFLDAVGGALVLGAAMLLARPLTRVLARHGW